MEKEVEVNNGEGSRGRQWKMKQRQIMEKEVEVNNGEGSRGR